MYPKRVNLFIPWSKAMVAGATVAKPDYGKTKHSSKSPKRRKKRRRRRRRKKVKDA